jgi:hypothetical protein
MNSRRLIAKLEHELFLLRRYRILPRRKLRRSQLRGVDPEELEGPEHDMGRSRVIPGVAVKDDKKFKHRWKRTR